MNRVMAACAGIAFVVASSMSYNDEVAAQEHYCSMVASGAWPAYNADIDCGGDDEQ